MLKKILSILIIISLFSIPCFADTEEEEVKKYIYPSIEQTSVDVREAIRREDVNIAKYFDFSVDFVTELISRLLKTGKLVYIVTGNMGGFQVSIYEDKINHYNIVAGLTEENEFIGVEITSLPLTGDLKRIFKKLHPEAFYVFSEEGNFISLGITYEWRD